MTRKIWKYLFAVVFVIAFSDCGKTKQPSDEALNAMYPSMVQLPDQGKRFADISKYPDIDTHTGIGTRAAGLAAGAGIGVVVGGIIGALIGRRVGSARPVAGTISGVVRGLRIGMLAGMLYGAGVGGTATRNYPGGGRTNPYMKRLYDENYSYWRLFTLRSPYGSVPDKKKVMEITTELNRQLDAL